MDEGPIRIEALADQEEMEELFKQSVEELEPAMDLTVNDERAEVDDVEITDVLIAGDVVGLSYEFTWSAHYTCDDISTFSKPQFGNITGILVDGYWVFQRFVPPPARSTHEEF